MIVSRETQDRFDSYLALLKKWSARINLVSASTLTDALDRHFQDSLQLVDIPFDGDHWVDLGSGGGFPGAVVAILLLEKRPSAHVTLVESDTRKATFLRTVSRETNVRFEVIAKRIEEIAPLNADVLSARALAPLEKLCGYCERHLKQTGKALFPKGETWQSELSEAQREWRFSWKAHTSITNPNAAILELGDISRA